MKLKIAITVEYKSGSHLKLPAILFEIHIGFLDLVGFPEYFTNDLFI